MKRIVTVKLNRYKIKELHPGGYIRGYMYRRSKVLALLHDSFFVLISFSKVINQMKISNICTN